MSDLPPGSRIGFVGLGSMGSVMAGHVMAAGWPVLGWDRDPGAREALREAGGEVAEGLKDFAEVAAVISIVFDDAATREIAFGPEGLIATLRPGAIHVVMASISPTLSRELHEAHSAQGQGYLAASMFGRPEAAAAGDLLINGSGERSAYDAMLPVLSTLGAPRWVGEAPEQAMLLKVMGNTMIVAAVELMREMFAILKAGAIPEAEAKRLLIDSLFPGPIFSGYAERYLAAPQETRKTAIAAKDNRLCLEAAERMGVEPPLVRYLYEQNLP